tara:strand:+ start:193 stop:300 length:108 start_codon:yes stop_codon:yes gene_type:complete
MDNSKNQKHISKYIKLEDYKVFDYEITGNLFGLHN